MWLDNFKLAHADLDPKLFWLHEEGSGEKLCSEVSCWNVTVFKSHKLCSQIFNAIGQVIDSRAVSSTIYGQVLLQFSNFHVLPYIQFLSLVELECWLADLALFPSSTLMAAFQCLRHLRARLSPRPFLVWPEGCRIQTTYTSQILLFCLFLLSSSS